MQVRDVGRDRGAGWRRIAALLVAVSFVAAACGDDDDDAGGGGDTPTTEAGEGTATTGDDGGTGTTADGAGDTTTTAAEGEPAVGGEATFLYSNEARSLDGVTYSGFAGENGHRMFAIYGALLVDDPATGEVIPFMAESFEPDDALTTWTLQLREGLTFTDGTPFDAAAVQFNWERVADPASGSPGIGTAAGVESYVVVDPLTLEIRLANPNAHLDRAAFRSSLNYIGSPTAIQEGHDMVSDPIGAGPFMVDEWLRDDRLVLVRNPDYFDAPRPYLDRLVIRVVTDEQQRLDTLLTGDGDLMWSNTPTSHAAIADAGGSSTLTTVSSGTGLVINTTRPPFDDVRLRQVLALALERDVIADMARPGTAGATNWAPDSSPWNSPAGDLPAYDPAAAQELLDEIVADNGGPVQVVFGAFQVGTDPMVAEFIQTTLNQLDGIEVTVDPVDAATATTRVRSGDYEIHGWGVPYTDPQPSLNDFFGSGLGGNYSLYSNPEVDALLAEDRAERDLDARHAIWEDIFTILSEEVPFLPTLHPVQGLGHTDAVSGVELYQDGVGRWDLVHRTDV